VSTVLVVERHRDGTLHPVGGHRSAAELAAVLRLVHQLRCQDAQSYRQVVAGLAERGHRVSLGRVWHYATAYQCSRCRDDS
jgi:hypothetical protein